MANNDLLYGERKFGQTFAVRVLLALLMLGPLVLAWAVADNPNPSAHPLMALISLVVVLCYVVLWVAISKTVLTITDHGVRRDSIFGVQEIPWSQISETRYVVRPIRVGAHFGLIGILIAAASGISYEGIVVI